MTTTAEKPQTAGWLYSPPFDKFLIFGVAGLAISSGIVVSLAPKLFPVIMVINLWALGYHHVIATFTRLCFDRTSHRRALWMIYGLLPFVLGIVALMAKFGGLWVISAVYLYGQWFHYSRQSWGISRAYERNAPQGYAADRSWTTQAAFYGFPIWGILHRSWQNHDSFLSMPIKMLPVADGVVMLTGAVCLCFLILWLVRVYRDWKKGVLPVAYTCFMMSHFVIFYVSYIALPSMDHGWLVANIWHNLQYLLFLWMFNNRTYKAGIDPAARFISYLSQRKNMAVYFTATFLISSLVYALVTQAFRPYGVTAVVAIYMTINFHHYIVEAIIWRASWIKRGRELSIQRRQAA